MNHEYEVRIHACAGLQFQSESCLKLQLSAPELFHMIRYLCLILCPNLARAAYPVLRLWRVYQARQSSHKRRYYAMTIRKKAEISDCFYGGF